MGRKKDCYGDCWGDSGVWVQCVYPIMLSLGWFGGIICVVCLSTAQANSHLKGCLSDTDWSWLGFGLYPIILSMRR